MKSTASVIASMKSASRNFVRTNRAQMRATLPKSERPVRSPARSKFVSVVDNGCLLGQVNVNTLFPMRDLRRLVDEGNRKNYTGVKFRVVKSPRDPLLLFFVHVKTDTVWAELNVVIKGNKRTLTARMTNGSRNNKLTNYVHREGRVVSAEDMLHHWHQAATASMSKQVAHLREYMRDDIGELAISIVEDLRNMTQTGVRKLELRAKAYNRS